MKKRIIERKCEIRISGHELLLAELDLIKICQLNRVDMLTFDSDIVLHSWSPD